ncbi:hypothetical protein CF392_16205 [Tamilnaduibacter salinus]|uniref:Uncharacterized protein n=1 Tax=Tamilnaduibacter salinus TaxID=1484056 RepID=A0A2A2I009_9GAMM|nr:hypothetical protein [Tamilnaduibacter salinus]PAV24450.1 hypothetical protein CF392_16205 [Tamilnaduibacter salinus]
MTIEQLKAAQSRLWNAEALMLFLSNELALTESDAPETIRANIAAQAREDLLKVCQSISEELNARGDRNDT